MGGGGGKRGREEGGQVIPICLLILLVICLMLVCIPKIIFLRCLEVLIKFLWVIGGWVVVLGSEFND
jgi:hypothetical protein